MYSRILTIPQVAEILQISKAKIYQMVAKREIPYIKIKKNIRVWEKDLYTWLDEMTVPANRS